MQSAVDKAETGHFNRIAEKVKEKLQSEGIPQ